MIKTDGTITNITGKIGGNIYHRDRYSLHIKPKTYRPHQPSTSQKTQRSYFNQVKNCWLSHAWTRRESLLWWNYCWQHPKKNKQGETRYLHPWLAFLSVNIKRLANSHPVIYTPT